jgi:hypothetical protein
MNTQLYAVHPDGSGLKRLSAGGKEGNWIGFWATTASTGLCINRRALSSVDALSGASSADAKLVSKNSGYGCLADLSRDGRHALLHQGPARRLGHLSC